MSLITEAQRQLLILNGIATERNAHFDPFPVARLTADWNGTIWLLAELMPTDPDQAFALKTIDGGSPELLHVSLSKLEAETGPNGETIQADSSFRPEKCLSAYLQEALYHHGPPRP